MPAPVPTRRSLQPEPPPPRKLPFGKAKATLPDPDIAIPLGNDTEAAPRIDQVHVDEVMAAARDVFGPGGEGAGGEGTGGGLDREDAIKALATALGYRRLGPVIRDRLDNDLRAAVRRGILENEAGRLRLHLKSITDYRREFLIEMLLVAISPGGSHPWTKRKDAIRATARHLGFTKSGKTIQAAMKSAITGALRRDLLEVDGNDIRRM